MEESSQVFGNEEECNSSESGWTTYICSPITKDINEDDEVDGDDLSTDDGDTNDDGVHDDEDDHESDDSMASDASSGPTHRRNSWGKGKDEEGKHRSKKKAKYPAEEKNGTKQEKEEGSVFTAKLGASVEVRISSEEEKVRKNTNWFGKRN